MPSRTPASSTVKNSGSLSRGVVRVIEAFMYLPRQGRPWPPVRVASSIAGRLLLGTRLALLAVAYYYLGVGVAKTEPTLASKWTDW
jgi:hypothetical protein